MKQRNLQNVDSNPRCFIHGSYNFYVEVHAFLAT